MALSFWFSCAVLAASLALYGMVFLGWHRLRELRDVDPAVPGKPPRVSIIVAARDEARAIEGAIRSILAIDYPALEIVAVDDRSTDGTGDILDRLRAEFRALQVVHVRELPPGWLGKNHALHAGGRGAGGDYLIFADADVVFEPSSIRRAVAYCEGARLDHLTVIPDVPTRSRFVELAMMGGFVGLLALHRPWRATETGRHDLGVGAFNMVRAAPYRALGGHETLALEVLDDIELGRLMGNAGLRQDMLLGHGMMSVEMYATAGEMFHGIQKNVFTFLDYSAVKLVAATLITFAFQAWPWLGTFLTDGATRWLNVAAIATPVALYLHLAGQFKYRRACVAYLPVMGFVTILLFWQIALRTWIRGGVSWRGTFYPLGELRRHRRQRRRGHRSPHLHR